MSNGMNVFFLKKNHICPLVADWLFQQNFVKVKNITQTNIGERTRIEKQRREAD